MNDMSPVRSHYIEMPSRADLDDYVCWSRMQSEAGQLLDNIIARKELERRASGGVFLWGVGNAPAVAIKALARVGCRVPVVFSIMKSRPKAVDVAPSRTFAWRRFLDASGVERELPPSAIVTSRGASSRGVKRTHYALMCYSAVPLAIERGAPFHVAAYRNAGGTGAPAGASQVTALLRRSGDSLGLSNYEINLRAWLVDSYWVRLSDAVEVEPDMAERLNEASALDTWAWSKLAAEVRMGRPTEAFGQRTGELLLL